MNTTNQTQPTSFRCGFVTLLGLPNAGKSTLFNKLTDSNLAIVTPKAQTTRTLLRGHVASSTCEFVVVDTPGLQEGTKALNQAIGRNAVRAAANAMAGGELMLLVIDAPSLGAQLRDHKSHTPPMLLALERIVTASFENVDLPLKVRVIPVFNKADLVRKPEHRTEIENTVTTFATRLFSDLQSGLWLSSHTESGISELLETIEANLPAGNPGELFESDTLTDQATRTIAAEYIREQCFLQLGDELPYSTAVEIETFDESDPALTRIQATIFVEKESQKGMVIGSGAKKIKAIGTKSRERIEALIERKAFLGLKVKVSANWAGKSALVERFGYGEVSL